jgi:hypothetical protein
MNEHVTQNLLCFEYSDWQESYLYKYDTVAGLIIIKRFHTN